MGDDFQGNNNDEVEEVVNGSTSALEHHRHFLVYNNEFEIFVE